MIVVVPPRGRTARRGGPGRTLRRRVAGPARAPTRQHAARARAPRRTTSSRAHDTNVPTCAPSPIRPQRNLRGSHNDRPPARRPHDAIVIVRSAFTVFGPLSAGPRSPRPHGSRSLPLGGRAATLSHVRIARVVVIQSFRCCGGPRGGNADHSGPDRDRSRCDCVVCGASSRPGSDPQFYQFPTNPPIRPSPPL